jgi:hypothetical protein
VAVALAVTAALVALMFTFAILERWLVRRRPHELAWAVAMALFVAGACSVVWGVGVGWGSLSFRLYYLFGAVLNVAWLALGQMLLSASTAGGAPRWRHRAQSGLVVASAFAAGVVLTAPLRSPIDPDELPRGDLVFGAAPRVLAGIGSGGGALIVFAGTVASTVALVRARRRGTRGAGGRAVGTGLIALGTLVLGRSGGLAEQGRLEGFALTLTIGITVLFAGYLVAASRLPSPSERSAAMPT